MPSEKRSAEELFKQGAKLLFEAYLDYCKQHEEYRDFSKFKNDILEKPDGAHRFFNFTNRKNEILRVTVKSNIESQILAFYFKVCSKEEDARGWYEGLKKSGDSGKFEKAVRAELTSTLQNQKSSDGDHAVRFNRDDLGKLVGASGKPTSTESSTKNYRNEITEINKGDESKGPGPEENSVQKDVTIKP